MSRHNLRSARARVATTKSTATPPTPSTPGMQPGVIDAYRRVREPSSGELFSELKNTVWTCASINASVCAASPPRLYVRTYPNQPRARCLTRGVSHKAARQFAGISAEVKIEEVVEHPILDLLAQVNPVHNAQDLWELTTFHQETVGSAYWLLDTDSVLGIPRAIWPLPAHKVKPVRLPGDDAVVSYYELRDGQRVERYAPESVIHFRYPDPREPYLSGLSPLRACFESAALNSIFMAYKRSIWDNAALPGAIVSPVEAIGPDERDRLEAQWQQRFRKGGNGRVVIAESEMNVALLQTSYADLAALAEAGATQADIANAFGVPLPFLVSETNLANLQAAEHQHASKAIKPRLARRDEKLNEQLVPLYDPTGRLFFASDDPTPVNVDALRAQEEQDLKHGVRSINQVRSDRGLPPVEWGERPWLSAHLLPTDSPERRATGSGRGRPLEEAV